MGSPSLGERQKCRVVTRCGAPHTGIIPPLDAHLSKTVGTALRLRRSRARRHMRNFTQRHEGKKFTRRKPDETFSFPGGARTGGGSVDESDLPLIITLTH